MSIAVENFSFLKKKEEYHGRIHRFAPTNNVRQEGKSLTMSVLSLIMGITAAVLSWVSNTVEGETTGWKIFYASIAFSFGMLYVLYFFIMKSSRTKEETFDMIKAMKI